MAPPCLYAYLVIKEFECTTTLWFPHCPSPSPSQDFDRRVIPVCGLEEVVVDDKTRRALRDIINFEKARSGLTAVAAAVLCVPCRSVCRAEVCAVQRCVLCSGVCRAAVCAVQRCVLCRGVCLLMCCIVPCMYLVF